MARRAAGGSGALVALVIFVILWVISTGLAILFYTRSVTAEEARRTAGVELDKWASSADRTTPDISGLVGQSGKDSVARQLFKEVGELRGIAIGNNQTGLETLKSTIRDAGAPDRNLLGEVGRLKAELEDTKQQAGKQEELRKAAETHAQEADAAQAAAVEGFNKAQTDLAQAIQTQQGSTKTLETDLTQQRQAIEAQLQQAREGAGVEIKKRDDRIVELERTVGERDQTIAGLRKHTPNQTTVDLSRQPDGAIVTVQTGKNELTINRGRANRIIPGMTFEVYDAGAAIAPDASNQLRGKATIEVINVAENSSTARVVRSERTKTLREGDAIANAVYDPNMRFKFVVFGDFDIDNSGQTTVGDRRRIETMIREWGGTLADGLSYDTDFLVLGQEPKVPEPLPRGVIDPTRIQRAAAEKQRYEAYQGLINQAKELKIPVLNQNRFLQLVGYYQR